MSKYLKTFMNLETAGQFVKVGVIGLFNTVVYFALFNVLRAGGVNLVLTITIAYAIATFVSYLLNRRWSFELTDGKVSMRETSKFYVINIVAWAVTLAVVGLAQWQFGPLDRVGENVANLAAVVIILLPKFAGYRDIVFRRALREEGRHFSSDDKGADGGVPQQEFRAGDSAKRETRQPEV